MTQTQFIELSKSEIKKLNAGYGNIANHAESWRAGYEFAREHILKLFLEKNNDEFLTEVEEFATQELDYFDETEF